jgi:uncharacterized membrane protein
MVVAAAWVLLVLAAPVTAAGAPVSALTYALGSLICHQRPERSFHIDAAQLPVCARCFGLYVGAAAGAVVAVAAAGLKPCATARGSSAGLKPGATAKRLWRSPSGLRTVLRTLLVVAAMPTALSWMLEAAGVWAFSNAARFAAALPLGAVVALTVNYVECARPRRTVPSPPRIRT